MTIPPVRRGLLMSVAAAMLAGCAAGYSAAPAPMMPARVAVRASGGAGSLDPTFGSGGKVIVNLGMTPVAVAAEPDGRIVVLADQDSAGQVGVVRLLHNGKLDNSFGSHGIVAVDMWAAYSLTLLPHNKILLGGFDPTARHAQLTQLTSSGALDASFGSAGTVAFDFVANSTNAVLTVARQADGSIIAGGYGSAISSDLANTGLARFSAAGSIDTSFGSNGIVVDNLVGGVTALGLQSDGKILVCGGFFTNDKSLVVRFLSDGTLDKNDRGGTLVSVAHTGSLTFEGANAFQLDGKQLQWGNVQTRHGTLVHVIRRLRDGRRDPGFTSRRFAFAASLINGVTDVEIANGGDLLVGGEGADGSYGLFGLARLTPSGALDDTFGTKGRVVTSFGNQAAIAALTLDENGNVVAAGSFSSGGSNLSIALARYLSH